MKKKDYFWIVLLFLIDQLSKYYVSTHCGLAVKNEVIKNFFSITYVQNTGAAWSMLEGMGLLFVSVAVAVCGAIIYYMNKYKVSLWQKTALILVIAGALGNALDRLVHGYVIDFLDFIIFGYDYPVFNVADIFITCAAVLLIVDVLFTKEEK